MTTMNSTSIQVTDNAQAIALIASILALIAFAVLNALTIIDMIVLFGFIAIVGIQLSVLTFVFNSTLTMIVGIFS